ncbi:MAG TPA: GspE/PulE family protein, partial [Isosphaeraceae bacterium]
MIRPRLALATFALVALGLAIGADAAEAAPALFAQAADVPRGPGLYLNLFKFLPVLALYVLWVWSTHWVDDDTRELNNIRFEMWNSIVFFSGALGLALVWAIPIYPIGLTLLLVAYLAPILTYVYARNQTVPDDEKVLTPYHIGELINGLMNKLGMRGMFNRGESNVNKAGPPIHFIGKSQGSTKVEPERIEKAEQSKFYMSAKELVYDAVLRRATDIHLEPTPEQLSVRYRIDGIMHAAEPFDRPTGDAVINIFKILSAMDISERRKPQDGSFGAKVETREIDFRVATSGSKSGEKLVMRILDNASGVGKLEDSGMRPKLIQEIRSLVTQPHGMFLCCGPTGSGKSTTLYACLREIDRFQKNIITVEDPVEYRLDNVTQMEINTKSGQTFAGSLRSILRQDPDVIMIGEIRDQETATIACQAATTGHMVFSTVHANDTVTALFRLLDLGVEPFMIASALTAVLGQRLGRLLCDNCKEPYKPKPEFLKKANLPADKVDVFYR